MCGTASPTRLLACMLQEMAYARLSILGLLFFVLGCGGRTAPVPVAMSTPASRYPAARRADLVEDHHGVRVADPYRWLEVMDSDETRAWVKAENATTDAYFAKIAGRDKLRARLAELLRTEKFAAPLRASGRVFWR